VQIHDLLHSKVLTTNMFLFPKYPVTSPSESFSTLVPRIGRIRLYMISNRQNKQNNAVDLIKCIVGNEEENYFIVMYFQFLIRPKKKYLCFLLHVK